MDMHLIETDSQKKQNKADNKLLAGVFIKLKPNLQFVLKQLIRRTNYSMKACLIIAKPVLSSRIIGTGLN